MKTISDNKILGKKIIVSYGGGTNSTALLVGMVNQNIMPDAIIFCDTGGERPATYSYIEYFSKWLISKGFPEITITRYKTKKGDEPTLEEYIIEKKVLPPISYGYKSCSHKFKLFPFDKYVKKHFKNCLIDVYVGFDAGEERRVKDNTNPFHTNIYKLMDWAWDRKLCILEIQKAGLCLPGKSACFFCRNTSKAEIFDLSKELQNRAIYIEQNAKPNLLELKGLAGSWSWEALLIDGEQSVMNFEEPDNNMPCGCMD